MVPQKKLPFAQPEHSEASEMSHPIPFRPTAPRPPGEVLPLHRRRATARASAAQAADALLQASPEQCIQRAYYLEARKAFATDTALAQAIGVNRSQVSRWAQGRAAHAANAWLLRDVAAAVSRMADFYNQPAIQRWLLGASPELDGEQPLALLRQGRLPEVLMAIEAQTSGAFA